MKSFKSLLGFPYKMMAWVMRGNRHSYISRKSKKGWEYVPKVEAQKENLVFSAPISGYETDLERGI